MTSLELAGTLVGSIFGSQVLVSIAQGWFNRKKVDADADSQLTQTSLEFIKTLTTRIDKLESTLESARMEMITLHREVAALKMELGLYKDGKVQYTPKVENSQ